MAKKKDTDFQVKGYCETVQREVEVGLTEEDVSERTLMLGKRNEEKYSLLDDYTENLSKASEAKQAMKEYQSAAQKKREEVDRKQSEIDGLIRTVSTRTEKRCVDCTMTKDFSKRKQTITVIETGEIIEQVDMPKDAVQTQLNLAMQNRKQSAQGYIDEQGRRIFASDILSNGQNWQFVYQGENGVLYAYASNRYDNQGKACAALEKLAEDNGWEYYDTDSEE